MTHKVAALYRFVPLPDFRALREPLRAQCNRHRIKGTLLLAAEGINGTIAGADDPVDALIADMRDLFGGRLDGIEIKHSRAAAMPFRRMKVRLKKKIVTLGAATDPAARVGTYVEPEQWNALIADDDTLVIDTRNAFEVAMGTFEGALDPKLSRFSEFRDFVHERLDPQRHRRIAMFCTGGILKYLEQVAEAESRWKGACFVFDERVALGHGLTEQAAVPEIYPTRPGLEKIQTFQR